MPVSYSNETTLVHAMVNALRREFPGIWVVKVHGGPYQAAGVPDLIGCWKGLMFGIEAKHRKAGESEEHAQGRTTAIQRVVIGQINAAGGVAGVALTPDEAVSIVHRTEQKALRAWGSPRSEVLAEREGETEGETNVSRD